MEGVIMETVPIKNRLRKSPKANLKGRALLGRSNSINGKNNRNITLTRSRSIHKKNVNNINNVNKLANEEKIFCGGENGNECLIEADFVYGPFTREVFNAICVRLGHTVHIPENHLQAVFNELQLYPSKSQVSEMIKCARQCSNRNGNYITFGEFCVLVKEMQKPRLKPKRNGQHNFSKCKKSCEVFLGGSCNPTTWRADTVIPAFERAGITFYNPQVSIWGPELVAEEYSAKESALILFFVVDSQTRSTSGMIEVAYLVASGRCVIVVAHPYYQGQQIMGETISYKEYKDLMSAQSSLLTLVQSQGVKVHKNLTTAIQCTAKILRNASTVGINPEEQILNKLRRLREVFDNYSTNSSEITLLHILNAYHEVTHRQLEAAQLEAYLSMKKVNDNFTDVRITFDQFCALVAEFSTETSCDSLLTSLNNNNQNEWASKSIQRQNLANNNCNTLSNFTQITIEDKNSNRTAYNYNIYLGGSLSTKNHWRSNIAIPLLKKHGLSYYNPSLRDDLMNSNSIIYDNDNYTSSKSNDVLEWKQSIDKSEVVLFVVTNDTRSLSSMIMAGYSLGIGKKMVLCIQEMSRGVIVDGEELTDQAVKDYNRGRTYLSDFAHRKNVTVFNNIEEAVESAIDMCNK